MQLYLHKGSLVMCDHGGSVQLQGEPDYLLTGQPAVTERKLLESSIVGCPNSSPVSVPCTKIVAVLSGQSLITSCEDSPVLLQSFVAQTNGSTSGAPHFVRCTSPNQKLHGEASGEREVTSRTFTAAADSTWLAIRLLDEADEPVAGARYRVTLPDGRVLEGLLGPRGRKRWVGIPAGTCRVQFPGLAGPDEQSPPPGTLELRFKTQFGNAVADPAGFVLTSPDGTTQECRLTDGRFERDQATGNYRAHLRYIESVRWVAAGGHAGDPLPIEGRTRGFADGTDAELQIFERDQDRSTEPLATLSAKVRGGRLTADWTWEPEVGVPARGAFVCLLRIGAKLAWSEALHVTSRDLDGLDGVQEHLRALGFDAGPVDGIAGPRTERAVRAFQSARPPLAVDGIAGPLTKAQLAEEAR